MHAPTIGTIYDDNWCRRCGNPAGIYSTFDGLCPICYRHRGFIERITRAYVARIRPNVSPTCPYDAIVQHEPEALDSYAQEATR